MKIRFIEYSGDVYVVVGVTYDTKFQYPECYVAAPLDDVNSSIFRAVLSTDTLNIPFAEAIEITNKNRLISLMVLYG